MTDIKPRFEVDVLKGKRVRRMASPKKDKNGKLLGGFEYTDVDAPAGYMVYFPSGSSIHIWTMEEMIRQGFDKDPKLVDMESGEERPAMEDISLKSRSERKESVRKTSQVHHTS